MTQPRPVSTDQSDIAKPADRSAAPAAASNPPAGQVGQPKRPANPQPNANRPGAAQPANPNRPGAGQPGNPNRPGAGRPGNPAAPGGAAKPRPPAAAQIPHPPVRPPASKAKIGRRHIVVFISFLLFVLVPTGVATWYLYQRAADQYASYLGFSVRTESAPAATDLLGGLGELAGLGTSSSSDTDILYKFLQSHDVVQKIDDKLDLRAIWSKPENDPLFSYRGDGTLEDLMSAWKKKVRVYFDGGMIDLRVLAFDPIDAQAIGEAVLSESSAMINAINDVAREDTIRYAREELGIAFDRLKASRLAMTDFRNEHQIVDPTADVAGQAGILAVLQQQLAEALIQLGVLNSNSQANDPRIEQTELRIQVIRQQIEDERLKFGSATSGGEKLSDLVGEYEGLVVDREFAERTYTAARAGFDGAQAAAQRQSRYLAAYVAPTLAERAEYPQRIKLLTILSGFLMLIWFIGVLVYYSLRDRR